MMNKQTSINQLAGTVGSLAALLVVFAAAWFAGTLVVSDAAEEQGTLVNDNGAEVQNLYEDGAVDVCLRFMEGAEPLVSDAVIVAAIASLDSTYAGRAFAADRFDKRVHRDCRWEPPFDPLQGETSETAGVRLAEPDGAVDVAVFVYPQSATDVIGDEWADRVAPLAHHEVSDGVLRTIANAVLIGDQELTDPRTRKLLLAEGLGFNGPGQPNRPLIDGRCVLEDQTSPACGPEMLP